MRILLTSPGMGVGGAERVVAMLAAGLAARGHEVALAAPPGMRDADLAGVPHLRLHLDDHGRALAGAAGTARQLASAVRRVRPDVVHAQNVKATILSAVAARAAGRGAAPVLSTFHGVLPDEYARAARLLRGAAHVACVSEDLRARLTAAGFPAGRASVVHNAVEPVAPLTAERRAALDAELGLGDGPVAAVVGRLVPQKNHARFLVAGARAAAAVPGARFLVVGDGELRDEIAARRAALGLDGSVIVTGARADARDLIARADVLVFSSDWEGLSIAALEALSAGTPVLSTDVQGMRELLAGGAGEVVPLDDGRALGDALAALLADPARRAAMGDHGRALAASAFSVDAMVGAYEDRYAALRERRR
ncbi:MAG TPA: glycosyltransferase [Baekduia sp.]|uniref:glycosyltransferase n=1 Tax=Baekduia sp. TaxID=2600305 RepID=UPI002D781945|nr:glycosyltransferase [Baekduia sp.]HET6508410.1 glycosyltransferase [Baekduia sp.]